LSLAEKVTDINLKMTGILKPRNISPGFGGRAVPFAILTLAKKKAPLN
jgi:hypothetical protein